MTQNIFHLASKSPDTRNKKHIKACVEAIAGLPQQDITAQVNQIDENGKSPLFYAVSTLNVKMVEMLLMAGSSLSIYDAQSRSAFFAIRKSKPDQANSLEKIVTVLEARGVDFSLLSNDLLAAGVTVGSDKMVQKSLGLGANPNTSHQGSSALRNAIRWAYIGESHQGGARRATHQIVTDLLAAGADPNRLEEGAKTLPLIMAVSENRDGVVELLIRSGAKMSADDDHERQQLNFAFGQISTKIRWKKSENDPTVSQDVEAASKIVLSFLNHGFDFDQLKSGRNFYLTKELLDQDEIKETVEIWRADREKSIILQQIEQELASFQPSSSPRKRM